MFPGAVAAAALLVALLITLIVGDRLWAPDGVHNVQALGSWLKWPMLVFTFLGDEQFYLVALPLVYWCLHKGLGADLGILLVLSSFANTGVKSFFKHARPFWEMPALKLSDASSFATRRTAPLCSVRWLALPPIGPGDGCGPRCWRC
ncbi:MAG: hypothetical protein ACP5UQ_03735 [Anaerolineae bacterium]